GESDRGHHQETEINTLRAHYSSSRSTRSPIRVLMFRAVFSLQPRDTPISDRRTWEESSCGSCRPGRWSGARAAPGGGRPGRDQLVQPPPEQLVLGQKLLVAQPLVVVHLSTSSSSSLRSLIATITRWSPPLSGWYFIAMRRNQAAMTSP